MASFIVSDAPVRRALSGTGLICRSVYRNRHSGFVILVVFREESPLRDFVPRAALIPLFSPPWSLLPMELAQFQIAFQFCRDHLALSAPLFRFLLGVRSFDGEVPARP